MASVTDLCYSGASLSYVDPDLHNAKTNTYVHAYTYIYMYICMCIRVDVDGNRYTYLYVYIHIHIHTCAHICIYIYIYTCIYIYTYMHVHIYTYMYLHHNNHHHHHHHHQGLEPLIEAMTVGCGEPGEPSFTCIPSAPSVAETRLGPLGVGSLCLGLISEPAGAKRGGCFIVLRYLQHRLLQEVRRAISQLKG